MLFSVFVFFNDHCHKHHSPVTTHLYTQCGTVHVLLRVFFIVLHARFLCVVLGPVCLLTLVYSDWVTK